ncbi:MAG: hypothetical protein HYV46_17725, partial [candidate division NC10 bacterium]|nr:hypothetical protein [candidate division NC10 bacterium]
FADRDKLQQILINLVENAVKFTSSGGRVTVTARQVKGAAVLLSGGAALGLEEPQHGNTAAPGHWLEVAVADTGQGIPPEELGAIFEKFHQVRRDGQGKAQGTGLGLPIAKSLIELHGGQIWVDSQVGRGSRFVFTLPADDARPMAELRGEAGRRP